MIVFSEILFPMKTSKTQNKNSILGSFNILQSEEDKNDSHYELT